MRGKPEQITFAQINTGRPKNLQSQGVRGSSDAKPTCFYVYFCYVWPLLGAEFHSQRSSS